VAVLRFGSEMQVVIHDDDIKPSWIQSMGW
jgi:hypothetical protein